MGKWLVMMKVNLSILKLRLQKMRDEMEAEIRIGDKIQESEDIGDMVDDDMEFSYDSFDFFRIGCNGDKPIYKGSDRKKLNAIVRRYNMKATYSIRDKYYSDMC